MGLLLHHKSPHDQKLYVQLMCAPKELLGSQAGNVHPCGMMLSLQATSGIKTCKCGTMLVQRRRRDVIGHGQAGYSWLAQNLVARQQDQVTRAVWPKIVWACHTDTR